MSYEPGYPPFIVHMNDSMTTPIDKHTGTTQDRLPTKFVPYVPPKRGYQRGRHLINKSRNTNQGYYWTSNQRQPSFKLPTPIKSAFPDQHTFFDYVPAEVRENIYGQLVGKVIVRIDGLVDLYYGGSKLSTSVYQDRTPEDGQYVGAGGHLYGRQKPNFMCVCRQLFQEIRDVMYRNMTVVFSRRWDFLNTCGTRSLYLPAALPVHNPELQIFAASSDVFAKIRDLDIDLCGSSDFGNRIITAEAEKVASLLLSMIANNLPILHSLTLHLNDCSRISLVEGVFLPEPNFVDSLLAVKQIKAIQLLPGHGWKGQGPRQKVFQHNLAAFELLMQRHCSGLAIINTNSLSGTNRWIRLAKIGQLILSTWDVGTSNDRKSYEHAMTLIRHKVYAIENGARR